MAGRPRFHTTTSRAPRTPGVPSSHLATTLEMQQALMAMQQALARRSPASRVPTSATPEKCEAEMSTASDANFGGSFTREVAGAELDAPLPDVAQEVVAGAHRHPRASLGAHAPTRQPPPHPRREALWQLWRYSRPWESTLPRQVAELLQMWETRTCRENVSQRREEINDPRLGGGCLGPPADVWGRAGGWHRSVPPPDAPRLRHQWGACNVRGDGRGRHRGPDSCDENLAVDLEVATAAATTAALTDNGCITLDEASVTSAAADDPVYQLLVAKVLTGDWSPQSLDTDKLSAALLQYHNTPLRGADSSPAQLATGRHLRDGVPTARCNYKVDQHWRRALRRRELAMARSGDERVERQGPVRTLEPLSPGSRVWVQNQMTKVWDRSGVVAEALPHRQYTVRLDGSGRLSLRNRRHLRVKRGATLASPAPSHAGPTPATSPTPQPRQSTPSRPRRTSRRPQWLADYDESSPP
ncbi:hypothetical protein O3P69_014174 [Scylla paramamosain]|uniref:Uncharacterized protein n=1 Tax=Scylla paramamosain TaxID=85552 RepID=A0AAW0SK52_SCYPA